MLPNFLLQEAATGAVLWRGMFLGGFTGFGGERLCYDLFFQEETPALVLPCEFYRSFWGAFFTGHLLATASVLLGYYPNNSDLVELVYIVLQSLKPKLFKVFLMYFSWKWKFIYLIESVLYPRLNLFVLLLIYNQSDFCDQWFSVLLDSYIQRRYLEFFLTISLREKFSNTEFFLVRIFPHSDWIRSLRIAKCEKIRTTKNSVFGHFSRSILYLRGKI